MSFYASDRPGSAFPSKRFRSKQTRPSNDSCGNVFISFEIPRDSADVGSPRAPKTAHARGAERDGRRVARTASESVGESASVPNSPYRVRAPSSPMLPPADRTHSAHGRGSQRPDSGALRRASEDPSTARRRGRSSSSHASEALSARSKEVNHRLLQQLREPLPPGWEARITPGGQIYYANHVSRRTQWIRPTEEAGAASAAISAAEREDYDRRSLLSHRTDDNAGSGDTARQEPEEDGFGFPGSPTNSPGTRRRKPSASQQSVSIPSAVNTPRSAASHTRSPSRPVQRTPVRSEDITLDLGSLGFGPGSPPSTATNSTPVASQSNTRFEHSASPVRQQRQPSGSNLMGSPNGVSPRPVPNRSSRSPQRPARRTTPSAASTASSGASNPVGPPKNPLERDWREYLIDDDLGEFPVGWEQRTTSTGAVYFVDHIHRSTTFEDPRVADREERKRQALRHEAKLPQYKRDLRRKLLRLHDLFRYSLRAREKALQGSDGKEVQLKVSTLYELSRMNFHCRVLCTFLTFEVVDLNTLHSVLARFI